MVIVVVETIKQILPIIEITINRLMLLYYLHPYDILIGQKAPAGKVPLILPYEQMRIVAGPIVIGVS